MRQLILVLALALLPAAASAVILFNAGTEITATGTYPASNETRSGGLILYLKGDPDGATIDLETQPFRAAQGPTEWIPLLECSVTALPAVCKVAVGQGSIRLNVAGGLGSPAIHAIAYEASAVVGEVGGDGTGGTAIAIDADQDGTNNVFVASDVVTFDTDDDGEVDFEFVGSGVGGIVAVIRVVGDAAFDRHLRFDFANSGSLVQFSAITQANAGILMTTSNALISAKVNSATVPAFIPNMIDPLTGYGRDIVSGALSLTDNGVEVMRVQDNGVSVADGLRFEFPQSTTPPTSTESGSWYDEANAVLRINDGSADLVLTPRLDGELDNIAYVIDAAVPPDQDVHVSLFNSIGGTIDSVPHCYLTDDPGGIGKSADIPTAITAGVNQFFTQIGADIQSFFIGSDALGVVDLTFNESGGPAGDSYRLACLVDGMKFVSGIIIPRP